MFKSKSPMPKRTSSKEASERGHDKQADLRVVHNVNVLEILTNYHPERGEDYALHLYYRSNKHYPFFNCTFKSLNQNNEDATLVIDGKQYQVNIRTGVINDKGPVVA